jgi:hypothetical protein
MKVIRQSYTVRIFLEFKAKFPGPLHFKDHQNSPFFVKVHFVESYVDNFLLLGPLDRHRFSPVLTPDLPHPTRNPKQSPIQSGRLAVSSAPIEPSFSRLFALGLGQDRRYSPRHRLLAIR